MFVLSLIFNIVLEEINIQALKLFKDESLLNGFEIFWRLDIEMSPPHQKKCRKADWAAKCAQAVGSSLFLRSSFFILLLLIIISFISCIPSLKRMINDRYNYPSSHPHFYIIIMV